MENLFIDFWHLYAPAEQYRNRYLACQRLWDAMEETDRALILKELAAKQEASQPVKNEKNPYFYLIDWEPPQAQWLSPKEVGHLLAQKIPLAVCFNPHTHSFGTVTKADADIFALEVHHYM
jgi:hypothetical protein